MNSCEQLFIASLFVRFVVSVDLRRFMCKRGFGRVPCGMRLHALLLVRDEGDIIAQTLSHLRSQFDTVHVLDTGSTDATWEVVVAASRSDKRVKPFARVETSGSTGLRAHLFEAARAHMRHGDWFARVDADEFYHLPVRNFLLTRVSRHEGRVFAQHYEFVLLRSELEAWERAAACSMAEPTTAQPGSHVHVSSEIQNERTRYIVDERMWFEARLFRFRRGMKWHESQPNPFNPGLTAVERIPIRHYRWRSLEQVKRRCELRMQQSKLDPHGEHWQQFDYRSWAVADDDPRLRTWSAALAAAGQCEDLPTPTNTRHLEWPAKRRKQVFLYRSGLVHVLDLFRKRAGRLRRTEHV